MQTVTAAVIRRNGEYLIARRREGGDLSGKWEFPGGKCEPGEGDAAALARELREELAIEAAIGAFVAGTRFEHAGKPFELRAYEAEWTGGQMELREHQEIRWVVPADFGLYDFAPSDQVIVRALERRDQPL
jgi:mutator protein MutT